MSLHRKDTVTYDPITGLHRVHQFDNIDGRHVFSLHQDVEPVLEFNKAMANERPGPRAKEGFRHVASIPLIIIEKWMRDYGVNVWRHDHWDKVRRLLNDPDWRYLRTDTSVL